MELVSSKSQLQPSSSLLEPSFLTKTKAYRLTKSGVKFGWLEAEVVEIKEGRRIKKDEKVILHVEFPRSYCAISPKHSYIKGDKIIITINEGHSSETQKTNKLPFFIFNIELSRHKENGERTNYTLKEKDFFKFTRVDKGWIEKNMRPERDKELNRMSLHFNAFPPDSKEEETAEFEFHCENNIILDPQLVIRASTPLGDPP